jgi:eukaryotic-like serine/threonine-protein kinase
MTNGMDMLTRFDPGGGSSDRYRARTLPSDEQAELEQHLEACSSCRNLVARDHTTADTAAIPPGHRAPRAPAALLPRGTLLGRYVLLDVLGSGGMAVVYAAFDPELNRRVAIKLVRAELGRDELWPAGARRLRRRRARLR